MSTFPTIQFFFWFVYCQRYSIEWKGEYVEWKMKDLSLIFDYPECFQPSRNHSKQRNTVKKHKRISGWSPIINLSHIHIISHLIISITLSSFRFSSSTISSQIPLMFSVFYPAWSMQNILSIFELFLTDRYSNQRAPLWYFK